MTTGITAQGIMDSDRGVNGQSCEGTGHNLCFYKTIVFLTLIGSICVEMKKHRGFAVNHVKVIGQLFLFLN
jgi:hypothetical protein